MRSDREPAMPSSSALENALLNRAWIQWAGLGVDATVEVDDAVVDPEALIALTAELGDADPRLRDVSTDWCVAFGRYVSGSRLKRVVSELRTPTVAIGEYATTVAAAGGPAWLISGEPRADYQFRGKARLESASSRPRLLIRLRAAFGVNARADVLAALLDADERGRTIASLARRTRFTKPTIASVVEALVLAGLIEAVRGPGDRHYARIPGRQVLPGLRAAVPQPDWTSRFGVALELLRFERREFGSPAVRLVEARRLAESMMDAVVREGIPRPMLDETGPAFLRAYDRWIAELVYWLRLHR
jgi:hypothetical protein